MAAKYYCDICEVPLTEKVGEYGHVEGSGIRSTAERDGRWERCKLSEAQRHFCLICGFGIADAFVRGNPPVSSGAVVVKELLLMEIAKWWEAYHVGDPPKIAAKKYIELEQLAERAYSNVMLS